MSMLISNIIFLCVYFRSIKDKTRYLTQNVSNLFNRSDRSATKRPKKDIDEEILQLIKTNQADRRRHLASVSNETSHNNELKSFFANIYETTAKLSRDRQRKIKRHISNLVLEMEEEEEVENEMTNSIVIEYKNP